MTTRTPHLTDRLLDLWADPIPDPDEARAAFRSVYADPLTLNGTEIPLQALVDRALATHAALERTAVDVLEVVESPGSVVVAFELTARHVGTWHSVLGDVPATGRSVTVRVIDVLTLTAAGLVGGIRVVTDEASLLAQLGARVAPLTDVSRA
jgi:hypothetical protein